MIDLGLTSGQMRRLMEVLVENHELRIIINTMDLNHGDVADISESLSSGQVNFDATADVTRTADIVILDPDGVISFAGSNPMAGGLFMDRMIRITYCVKGMRADDIWFGIPLFTGPITALSRDGVYTSITAQGKDVLGYSSVWSTRNFKKNALVMDIIEVLFKSVLGEKHLDIKSSGKRRKGETKITRESVVWKVIQTLAGSAGMFAFYNGRGTGVVRKRKATSVFRFDEETILTEPKFSYDPSTIINSVRVTGGKPKGKGKKAPTGQAVAPPSHPLSPQSLGRNGSPRYYTTFIEDSSLKTKKACDDRAKAVLAAGLRGSINAEFTSLVMPLLEENDVYTVTTESGATVSCTAQQWSIPLTADGAANMGYIKRVAFGSKRKKTAPKKTKKPKRKSRFGPSGGSVRKGR